jgi:RimJ/RimL family protein N-acetyltransferase
MITLVPAALAHAPVLQALFEDPEVIEHLAFPWPYPPGEMARYLAAAIEGRAAGTRYVWVTIEPDGAPSGIALLKDVDLSAGTAELGYAFGRPFWGGGRATNAAAETMRFAFETLQLASLRATCGVLNTASLRVLEKLGFREERRYEEVRDKWPAPRVQIVHRVTRETWRTTRGLT